MKSLFDKFEAETQKAKMSNLKDPVWVATMAGPSVVIECVVKKASKDSGIKMDWHFSGGRAIVYAEGDWQKARYALYSALPQHDLTEQDLFSGLRKG